MKRFWTQRLRPALLIAALSLALCACGGAPDYDQVKLVNGQSGDTLTLGMSRASVDALLLPQAEGWTAQETERSGLTLVEYQGGDLDPISVWFQDDQAVYFSIGVTSFPRTSDPVPDSPWTLNGLGLGSTQEEVEAALGFPTMRGADLYTTPSPELFQLLQYNYLSDGTLLAADTGDEAFSAAFFFQEGKVVLFGVFGPGFDLSFRTDNAQDEAAQEPETISSPMGYRITIPAGCSYGPLQDVSSFGPLYQDLEGLRIYRDGVEICGLIRLPFEDPQRLSAEGFTRADFDALLRPLLGEGTENASYALRSSRYGSFMMELVLGQETSRHFFFPGQSCFYDLWHWDWDMTLEEEHNFLGSFYCEE